MRGRLCNPRDLKPFRPNEGRNQLLLFAQETVVCRAQHVVDSDAVLGKREQSTPILDQIAGLAGSRCSDRRLGGAAEIADRHHSSVLPKGSPIVSEALSVAHRGCELFDLM